MTRQGTDITDELNILFKLLPVNRTNTVEGGVSFWDVLEKHTLKYMVEKRCFLQQQRSKAYYNSHIDPFLLGVVVIHSCLGGKYQ